MPPSPFVMQQIHNMYGDPNLPIWEQFVNYIGQLLRGDFGRSIMYYPMEVTDLIGKALPWTLWLGITPVSMFFSNIPAFWLGLLSVWVLAYNMQLFPPQGSVNQRITPQSTWNWDWVVSVLEHSVLPLGVLIVTGFAGWLFSMRNMMITTINEDYVHLARAKGLSPERIRNRYAARNALLPNITGLAMAIGGLLTAIVLAEGVFVYPGLGGLVGAATGVRDYPLMQALMLMIILMSLIFNFIADSIYVILDPRTRETN